MTSYLALMQPVKHTDVKQTLVDQGLNVMGDHISNICKYSPRDQPISLVVYWCGFIMSLPLTGATYLFNTVWVGVCVCVVKIVTKPSLVPEDLCLFYTST